MDIQFWAATDVGRVREHNEDNFLVDKRLRLFVVCDGMGGHAAGEVASAMCVKLVREALHEQRELIEQVHQHAEDQGARARLREVLERALQLASRRVYEASLGDESKRGMGTTCCVLLLTGQRAFVAHVGDSRIYLLRGGEIAQITEDHSLYNEMVRLGKVRAGEAVNLPNKNAVTRAIGVREKVEVDVEDFALKRADRFLVCSDGLSGYFASDAQIAAMLKPESVRAATERCIEFAVESGGRDNITAILVQIASLGERRAELSPQALEALKRSPIFEYLSSSELGRLAPLIAPRHLSADEALAAPGEPLCDLAIVVRGEVELFAPGGQRLRALGPGETIGKLGFVDAEPSPVSVRAVGEVELLLMSRARMLELLRQEPALSVKILWNVLQSFASQIRTLPLELIVDAPGVKVQRAPGGPDAAPASNRWEDEDTRPPAPRPVPTSAALIEALDPSLPERDLETDHELEAPEMWGFEATYRGSLQELTEPPHRDDDQGQELRATTQLDADEIAAAVAARVSSTALTRSAPTRRSVDLPSPRAPRPLPAERPASVPSASPPSPPSPDSPPQGAAPSTPKKIATPFGSRRPVTGSNKALSAAPKKKKRNPFGERPLSPPSSAKPGSTKPNSTQSSSPASRNNEGSARRDDELPRDPLARTVQLGAEDFDQVKATHSARAKQNKSDSP